MTTFVEFYNWCKDVLHDKTELHLDNTGYTDIPDNRLGIQVYSHCTQCDVYESHVPILNLLFGRIDDGKVGIVRCKNGYADYDNIEYVSADQEIGETLIPLGLFPRYFPVKKPEIPYIPDMGVDEKWKRRHLLKKKEFEKMFSDSSK